MLIELNKTETIVTSCAIMTATIELLEVIKNTITDNNNYRAQYLLRKTEELLYLRAKIEKAIIENEKEEE